MMPQLEKGKLLHKRLIHLLICGMKPVPIAGAVVEFVADWWKFSDELQQNQQRLALEERVAQLEEAMAITPEQARAIAQEVIAAERQQGLEISEEKAQAVTAIASALPANIRERTQATLRQARRHGTALHTVLPLTDSTNNTAQREFYRSLLPARCPRFRENETIPYGPPQWRLVQLIGSGGFGEVWEVRHQQLGDQFAVKFCQDSVSAQALQREAEALFKLRKDLPEHPHIVRLVDLQLEQEPYWLAFEYVSGGTLEALMRAKSFTWQEALQVFIPVLQGMSAVHSLNIVHRDLKPANILLTESGVPKIADFGIGKVLIEQEQQRSLISPSLFVAAGSVGYAPPEQLKGEIAHPADDVYALAVILWQLLTHSLDSPHYVSATLAQVDAPQEIKDLILNCWGRPRAQRPQQAGELLSILQPLVPIEDLQRARVEVETLEQELTALDSRLATVVANREVTQQRELEREKLRKQQELSRKELHVKDLSRHAGYQQALAEDKQERAQLEQEASVRLARLRQQVEEKRQAWAKAETHQLQPAIDELLTIEKSLAEIEGQYAQEKQMQQAQLKKSLQQALQELGKFKPARDRFEYEQEYQARLAREQQEYETQRQRMTEFWQQAQQEMEQKLEAPYQQAMVPLQQQQQVLLELRFEIPLADLSLTLADYSVEKGKLAFTVIRHNFSALKQLRVTGEVSISRGPAREYWQHPELLLPYLVLKLDNGGRLAVVEVGFEPADGTRYLTDQAKVVIEDDQEAIRKKIKDDQAEEDRIKQEKQKEKLRGKHREDMQTFLVISLGLSVFICVVYLISQGFATVASMMGYHPPIWVELLTSVVFTLGTLTFFAFSWGENSLNLTFVIGLLVSIGYSFPMLPSMLGYHFPVWADLLVSIVFTFGITFTWLRKSKGIRYLVGKVTVVISAIFVIFSIISIITLTGHGFSIVATMMGYNFPIWLNLLAGLAGVVFTLGILDRLWGGNGVSNFFIISLPISMGYGFSMVTSKMGYNPPIWLDGLMGIVFTFVVVFLLAFLEAEKSKNQ